MRARDGYDMVLCGSQKGTIEDDFDGDGSGEPVCGGWGI